MAQVDYNPTSGDRIASNTGGANADTTVTLADPGDGAHHRIKRITVSVSGATAGDANVEFSDGTTTTILGALTNGGRGNVFDQEYCAQSVMGKKSTASTVTAKAAGASTVLTVTVHYDVRG